jgi:ATP-dependent DNA ligase
LQVRFSLDPLDPCFIAPKPKNSVPESTVLKLQDEGRLVQTRKRDGYFTHAVFTKRGTRLYTRGHADVTDRYPSIAGEISELGLPVNTVLSGELLVDQGGFDNFSLLSEVTKSDLETSLGLQNAYPMRYMIFNVPVLRGRDITNVINRRRFDYIQELFLKRETKFTHLQPLIELTGEFQINKELVRKQRWEGMVVYDTLAGTRFELHGKLATPPRPVGAWKWKPLKEDDFIAYDFVLATKGKNEGRVKDFKLAQVNRQTGAPVDCGKLSLGLSFDQRLQFTDKSLYPLVLEVAFESRFYPQGTLKNGRIRRIRDDKSPEECLFPTNAELLAYSSPEEKD